MITNFETEIKDYLFNISCTVCNDYLFLLIMEKKMKRKRRVLFIALLR